MRRSIAFFLVMMMAGHAVAQDAPPVPLSQNAALQYWLAISFLEDAEIDDYANAKPGEADTAGLLETTAMKYVHRAGQMPSAEWGIDYSESYMALLPHLSKCRQLGAAGMLWARNAVHEDEDEEAANTIADVIALARHVSSEPILINLIVGCAVQNDATSQGAALLPNLSPQALDVLSRRLESLPRIPTFESALRLENYTTRRLLTVPATERQIREALAGDADEIINIRKDPAKVASISAEIDALTEEAIRVSKLPVEQWPQTQAVQVEAKLAKPLVNDFFPTVFKAQTKLVQSDLQFFLFHAAVAVVKDGPDAAAQFKDPYASKRIHYQALEDGFELSTELKIDNEPVKLRVSGS